MLTFFDRPHSYCDGVSRRSFLQIGGLAAGGLTMADVLRAEQANSSLGASRQKSVIFIYLSGGLSHQDTFDLKPEAPKEIRGDFKPIATNVPGISVGELLPKTAAVMDKLIVLRSIVGQVDEHSSFQNLAGYRMDVTKRDGYPHLGSVIARVKGTPHDALPPFVDLFPKMKHFPYNSPGPGYLGRMFGGVTVDGDDLNILKLQQMSYRDLDRRRSLMSNLDQFRREASRVDLAAMDPMYQRAFDVLTSSRLVAALDVDQEPAALRDRYGRGSTQHLGDGAPMWNDQLLMARRLVEAGVRLVTVAYGFWDTHGNNFNWLRERLPLFDQGVSALVSDIYDRGLDKDVTVVVWGEFGRTPKINKDAGRDHWARVNSALLSGGGMRTGQVIGSTDSQAAVARNRPIHFHDLIATIYNNAGVSPSTFVKDISSRPVAILPSGAQPIAEVYG